MQRCDLPFSGNLLFRGPWGPLGCCPQESSNVRDIYTIMQHFTTIGCTIAFICSRTKNENYNKRYQTYCMLALSLLIVTFHRVYGCKMIWSKIWWHDPRISEESFITTATTVYPVTNKHTNKLDDQHCNIVSRAPPCLHSHQNHQRISAVPWHAFQNQKIRQISFLNKKSFFSQQEVKVIW